MQESAMAQASSKPTVQLSKCRIPQVRRVCGSPSHWLVAAKPYKTKTAPHGDAERFLPTNHITV